MGYSIFVIDQILEYHILCPSPTVPNLLPNEDECKKFEIRANSCWGKTKYDYICEWPR